ncbi:MAG TPA: protein kinase [Candidatus Polarisedimenticolia bacterium]|nr:protein kinase [Candidatus Polarisedimenticolia bacterium]
MSALSAGDSFAHYRVTGRLGAGGMGEVFRASDTRLGREVALKVLPELSGGDPDRLARFEREARILASLNHPGIAAIHGLEEAGGVRALVMELVEGPTLADHLARGALACDEALPIARQIADALEYAHERSVVHRDLKPANVKVRPDGAVKVLDFGLAKALEGDGPAPDVSFSPTLTAAATKAGTILGTAAYMSPEQARGRPVDRRADIWAFGAVLYEMLAGRRLASGETASEILASVIKDEPDWQRLPAGLPAELRRLLGRCLIKDARLRLRDIGEARVALESLEGGVAETAGGQDRSRAGRTALGGGWMGLVPWTVAALAASAAVAIPLLGPRPALVEPAPRTPVRLSVVLDQDAIAAVPTEMIGLAASRDGGTLAFCVRRGGSFELQTRRLEEPVARPLPGTQGGHSPFFSPDGRWIGFFTGNRLKKILIGGSQPIDLCETQEPRAGVWLDDGTIVLVSGFAGPLSTVSSSGGEPVPLTSLDTSRRERTHRWPDALPGTEWVLFTVGLTDSPGSYDDATIEAVSLKTKERKVLVRGAAMARFAPPDRLLYARRGELFAVPFDPGRLEVTGPPVSIVDRIDGYPTSGASHFAVAGDRLAYLPAASLQDDEELVWIDRSGTVESLGAPLRPYGFARILPELGEIVFADRGDIWRYAPERGSLTRMTTGVQAIGVEPAPGGRILYTLEDHDSTVLVQSLDGGRPVKAVSLGRPLALTSVTPDGGAALVSEYGISGSDIHMVFLDGVTPPRPVVQEPVQQWGAALSPDGRWLAYSSSESGSLDLYVRRFPGPGPKWLAAPGPAWGALWGRDGREVFFLDDISMKAVPVEPRGDTIAVGKPSKLFDLPLMRGQERDWRPYDLSPDGKRFLMVRVARPEAQRRRIDVLIGWRSLAGGSP